MKCPECEQEIGDPEYLKHKIKKSGKSYNDTFGQDDHWFVGDFLCPYCNQWFEYGDSSL